LSIFFFFYVFCSFLSCPRTLRLSLALKVLSHPEEVAAARCLPMEAVDAGSGAPHAVEDQQGAAIAAAARASSSAAAAAAPEEASPSEVRGLCGSAAVSPSSTAVRNITV